MKRITLHGSNGRGIFILVDDEYASRFNKYRWHLLKTGYASTSSPKLLAHHLVLPPKKGLLVDHINRDKLDNRTDNLRYVSNSQSLFNTGKRKGGTSIYKGVFKVANIPRLKTVRWAAQINYKGKRVHLGYFDTERQAALAYDLWAVDIAGEYANLNSNVVSSIP